MLRTLKPCIIADQALGNLRANSTDYIVHQEHKKLLRVLFGGLMDPEVVRGRRQADGRTHIGACFHHPSRYILKFYASLHAGVLILRIRGAHHWNMCGGNLGCIECIMPARQLTLIANHAITSSDDPQILNVELILKSTFGSIKADVPQEQISIPIIPISALRVGNGGISSTNITWLIRLPSSPLAGANPLNMTLVSNNPGWWPLINVYRVSSYFVVASATAVVYDWALSFGQEVVSFYQSSHLTNNGFIVRASLEEHNKTEDSAEAPLVP
ncbi:uncharacterized protein EDB91DRAFT_1082972 [Suillus paluster]|uniref:uncharacterized protein n=1 Tax=Suillus paluster TaxID=48578 RepID=UPI001B8713BF|nr:uncharacterized protein EDB91DRAFT_1082972 [Suillus paluster]KAG1737884.1 hypothetical protein EDB91DRAFT_1082972 [Suillus paluster]